MKSPFAIFRKHQRILTVVLTGLAMFAFVILGSVGPSSGQGLPPGLMVVTGAVVGAGLMWFFGTSTGNPKFLSTAGAILGAAVALWMVRSTKAQPPVQTAIGSYTEKELTELVHKRQLANRFIRQALQETRGEAAAMMARNFVFPEAQNTRQFMELMVTAELLRHEAREMGMVIGDEAIVDFIKRVTDNGMTAEIFEKITGDLRVSGRQLYDILRNELLAREARRVLQPSQLVFTPHEYWEMYRKFNVNQELDLAAVPLAPFTAGLKAPSDAELKAFFEEAKTLSPDQVEPGEPAFAQPERVRFAYLEADYRTFERKVPEPTDEEVKEYYELNKETLYRNFQRIPDSPADDSLDLGLGEPDTRSSETPEDAPLLPEFTPDQDAPNGSKSDDDTPAPDADEPGKEKTDGNSPEANDSPKTPPKKNDQAALLDARGTTPVALLDEEPTDEQAKEPKDEPPKDGKAETSEPESGDAEEGGAESEALPELPELPVLENRPPPPPLPRAAQYRPLDEELKAEIRDELRRERTRELIRETIDEAQLALLDVKVAIPDAEADDQEKARRAANNKTRERYVKRMKELAEELDLEFVQTPPLSASRFEETVEIPPEDPDALPIERPKYSLSAASKPSEIEFQRTTSVTQLVYGREVDVFQPSLASGSVTAEDGYLSPNRFVYVVLERIPAGVPQFSEPGIKEQVLKAWKIAQVRDEAKKRAEALAEKVRKAGEESSMSDVLAGQSITGKKATSYKVDGREVSNSVSVLSTPPFTWMEQSSAPRQNPFAPPQISAVPGTDNIDDAFMRYVFTKLDIGEVGVTHNRDRTIYYVVKVTDRDPKEATPETRPSPSLAEGFMSENFFGQSVIRTPYFPLMQDELQRPGRKWQQQLHEKYEVQWLE